MTPEQQRMVNAVYRDARKTWPAVTLEYLTTQAEALLKGERPQGGPGMMLADTFVRAGFIPKIPD